MGHCTGALYWGIVRGVSCALWRCAEVRIALYWNTKKTGWPEAGVARDCAISIHSVTMCLCYLNSQCDKIHLCITYE